MSSIRKNGIQTACILVIAAFLAVFSVINFFGFEQFCTPDMYSDTYVARLMWQEKTIFPESWVFGNQFYVCVTPVLAAVFYGLCGSMNLAMALATTAMTVLILLSFRWMVKPFASREQILLGMAVLLGSVLGLRIETTIEGQIFYIMASYYAGYLVTLFVVFGVYVRERFGMKTGWVSLLLAMVLSFCTGMQSLRQTAVMIVPLAALEGLRALAGLVREKRLRLDRAAWCAMACAVSNALGLIAIRLLSSKALAMFDAPSIATADSIPGSLRLGAAALRSVTGLKYLGSETPVLGVLALALVAVVVLGLILAVMGRCREGIGFLAALFALSVLSVIAVCVAVNFVYLRSIYLFPWYAMPALAAMVLLNRWRDWRRWVVSGALIAVLVCNLCVSYLPAAVDAVEEQEHPDREIAAYLMDEGYTRVYGEWYRVFCVAAWTDGQVDAGGWFNGVCSILPYINPMDIYTQEDNDQGAYLVSKGEEQSFLERAEKLGAKVELLTRFESGHGLYTSDMQLMYHPEP